MAQEFLRRVDSELPNHWDQQADHFIESVHQKAENIATRKASQNALNGYGPLLPNYSADSADLTGSNLTLWKGSNPITQKKFQRQLSLLWRS